MCKTRQILFVLLILFVTIIFTSSGMGSEPVKIKGFFIGMSIDNALKNLERLGFEGLSIKENMYKKTKKYYSIRPGSGDMFKVETGLDDKTVTKLYFSSAISDRLFNTKGIGSEIFKSSFMNAYTIAELKPFKDNPGADLIKGWELYDLDNGVRIRIYINKDFEMIKTARMSEFSFD